MGLCALARGFTGGGPESPIQVHRRGYCTQRAHVLFFHFFNPIEPTVATEDVFFRLNTEVAVCLSVYVCVCVGY